MSPEEFKKKVNAVAYAAVYRENFGHKCDLDRKAQEKINEGIKKFIRVYPHSRKYETRRYNRENHTKDGTFLDAIKDDKMRRSVFLAMFSDYCGSDAPLQLSPLGEVVRPLAEARGDESLGFNGTIRLVFGQIPINWNLKKRRTGCESKSDIIMSDPKLQKLFRATVEKMLDEINNA